MAPAHHSLTQSLLSRQHLIQVSPRLYQPTFAVVTTSPLHTAQLAATPDILATLRPHAFFCTLLPSSCPSSMILTTARPSGRLPAIRHPAAVKELGNRGTGRKEHCWTVHLLQRSPTKVPAEKSTPSLSITAASLPCSTAWNSLDG